MTSAYTVRIAFLDVGQGDTMVVSIPETKEAVVVDCLDPEQVLTYLEEEQINHFRGLILTHLHLDHYKGAVQLLNNCEKFGLPCERVYFNWPPKTTKEALNLLLQDADHHSNASDNDKINRQQRQTTFIGFKQWVDTHDEQCGPLVRAFDESRLSRHDGTIFDQIALLHPRHTQMNDLDLNNVSAVLKVFGLNCCALLMADLEPKGFEALQNKVADLHCDLLKFPHHGAWRNADPHHLLDQINPSHIIISVGTTGIQYKHPNSSVFEAIAKRPQIHLLCTQATSQCHPDLEHEHTRHSIRDNVTMNLKPFTKYGFIDNNSCPCAGTVIVELGQTVRLVQPNQKTHYDVIKENFQNHQCTISPIPIN